MTQESPPRVLDSLALAYYLSGEPAKAAAVERKAIARLGQGNGEGNGRLRAELEKKLQRYVRAAEEAGLEIDGD